MRAVLEVRAARKTFGRRGSICALDGVDFDLMTGEIVGLVGPNGAGKSTFLLAATGMLKLDAGFVRLHGRVVEQGGSREIGYSPERPAYDPAATALEMLSTLARLRGMSSRDASSASNAALESVGLSERRNSRMGALSRGMSQRLALAQAMFGSPSVVLLDETLSGLDPVVHRAICRQVTALPERGASVLLSSHDLAAVEELATRVVVLVAGRVRGVLRAAEFARPGSLRERFFQLLDAADIPGDREALCAVNG